MLVNSVERKWSHRAGSRVRFSVLWEFEFSGLTKALGKLVKGSRVRSYKNNFSVEFRYAGILAFLLTGSSHVTIFNQSDCLNSSIA